jgi:pyridoxine/pyridoxamine 5'-phosphate oxidase
MRCDHVVSEEMSRDELMVLVAEQANLIRCQDGQITAMATQIADLVESNEALTGKLARLERKYSAGGLSWADVLLSGC